MKRFNPKAVSLAIGVCVLQAQAADSKLSYEEYKADYYRNYSQRQGKFNAEEVSKYNV